MASRAFTAAALRVVATLSAAYFISQFYRASVAVIAPELTRDVGLSPTALGVLTGAFFLAFAVAQIPLGVLLDRYGPRRTIPAMLGFAVAGSLVFAAAASPATLTLGRALMGVGCACVFMGALVTCARWFPPDRFATVSAMILAVGGTGALLATTPLAAAAELVGWRGAFVGMAAITAGAGVLVYAAVRDAPRGHPYLSRKPQSLRATLRGVREVLAEPRLPFVMVMAFVAYPAVATVLTLWAGPYLNDVYGLGGVARGNVLLLTAVAMIVGTMCYGPLDRVFDTRKGVVVGGALITVAVLVVLAAVPGLALWQGAALLVLLGLFGVYAVVVMTHGRSLFPERLVGRAVTVINTANFTGVAVMQVATGWIIGAFPAAGGAAPEAAYRAVFAFLAAAIAIALVFYVRVGDAKPSHGLPGEPRAAEDDGR